MVPPLQTLLFAGLVVALARSQEEEAPKNQYVSPAPAGNTFLAENFDGGNEVFEERWILSQAKKASEDGSVAADAEIAKYDGVFKVEAVQDEANRLKGDFGMVLKSKARHHAVSSALSRPFQFDHRPLIIQYEVQFQNGMECGGAYMKLLSQPSGSSTENLLKTFNDKTVYTIMFGPDKCGTNMKLHLILQHKNPRTGTFEEKHWKGAHNANGAMNGKFSEVFTDMKSHQYTLILSTDNTFEIQIDGRTEAKGHLLEDFDPPINPAKEIEDANDSKPEDWDEREKIPDPEAQKPEDWDESEPKEVADPNAEKPIGWLDDEPLLIPDPEASQPADWDEDMDGVWEAALVDNPKCKGSVGCGEWKAPMIANPKYKGKWRAPMIDNPAYKGKWKPRNIPNPDYFEDQNPFRSLQPIVAVGFELWSMSDAILFDNILVTDDRAVTAQWTEDGFLTKQRLLNKNGESLLSSAFVTFVDYSTQYPWLWAVYVLVVGVPIALLISYCCMSKTTAKDDEPARRKKADLEDDDDENEEEAKAEEDRHESESAGASAGEQSAQEEEDEAEEMVEQVAPVAANTAKAAKVEKKKVVIEAPVDEDEHAAGGDVQAASSPASKSGGARRRKSRKD